MKNKLILILFTLICCLGLCTCQKAGNIENKEQSFLSLFPNVEFNNDLVLNEDPFAPNMKLIGSDVNLVLKNKSQKTFLFSLSNDLYIFRFNNETNKWQQLDNQMTYYEDGTIIHPVDSKEFTDALVFSWPYIIDNGEPVEIRIVTIATDITESESNNKIGTYFDIKLDSSLK